LADMTSRIFKPYKSTYVLFLEVQLFFEAAA
jgi:hypothetical protein